MKKAPGVLFLLLCLCLPLAASDPPEIRSRSGALLDGETGTFLYLHNPDEPIPPASLAKLMTMHLVLEDAAAGKVSLDTREEPPSASWARNQPPRSSLMGLAPGQVVSLRELLLGMAIPSGNDAAVAAALRLSPSIETFAGRMNSEAAALGLVLTRFVEPSGISENNFSTAREFAWFCRYYLRRHPEALEEYHQVKSFAFPLAENRSPSFKGELKTRIFNNHNPLMETVEGVDGIKTGYIDEAGYNIAISAEREGTRFVAVILGAPAEWRGDLIRDTDGRNLLEWAFANYRTLRPEVEPLEGIRVWKGKEDFLRGAPVEALPFTVERGRGDLLRVEVQYDEPLIAPLSRGSLIGRIILGDEYGELRVVPIAAAEEVEKGNLFKRIIDSIRLFFKRFQDKRR